MALRSMPDRWRTAGRNTLTATAQPRQKTVERDVDPAPRRWMPRAWRFKRSRPGFWHRQARHCWPLGSTAGISVPSMCGGHVASEEGVQFVLDDAGGGAGGNLGVHEEGLGVLLHQTVQRLLWRRRTW